MKEGLRAFLRTLAVHSPDNVIKTLNILGRSGTSSPAITFKENGKSDFEGIEKIDLSIAA